MTCTTPLPERLDPPDAASECAVCHRVTEDGRDLELCDEAVYRLRERKKINQGTNMPTGVQFVCEDCQEDLINAVPAIDHASALSEISDALGLDEYEHPALRARKVVQRLQSSTAPDGQPILAEAFADNGAHSHWYLIDPKTGAKVWSEDPEECAARGFSVSSPAPVGVEVRDWLTTSDVIEAFGSWEDSKPWAYIADDLNRIVASRLPAIKPGEVETCEWHPGDIPGTGVRGWKTACGEAMYPKHRWRLGVDGLNYCPNCGKRAVQVSDDEWAARSAQATTTEKETPC